MCVRQFKIYKMTHVQKDITTAEEKYTISFKSVANPVRPLPKFSV